VRPEEVTEMTATASSDLWLDMIATALAPELRAQPWKTPGEMAQALDRSTVQTPALHLIDQLLVKVANGECERAIIELAPQEGKSERGSRRFPLWVLHGNPNLRIGIVSYGHDVARRWGRRIRDDLRAHPELGLTLAQSSQRQDEFELLGYNGGVVCVGIEGSLTSRPVDLLIIDDPYKDAKQADSKAWKQTVEDFWREVALPRLAPGAPVVLIQTRWREDDLAGWLEAEGDDWTVLRIPAQAEHDPSKGETDILGREPGEYLESARRRTRADWEKKKREVGSRAWNALYQGRPSPAEGSILKRGWWRQYDTPQWIVRDDGAHVVTGFDDLMISWDLTFKNTEGTDFVAGQVWARRGADAFLLDQVHGRMDFVETLAAFRQLAARWPQAVLKLVEDKANGPAVISSLSRIVPGIVPEEPQGGKEARAAAVSPLIEAGNVWLPSPELAPWVGGFIDEAAGFPTAAHDDQVDAMSQALNRLILQPLLTGDGLVTAEDLDDELAGFGSYLPTY
jgi:predicted phage terminase large subunit-like protein